MIQTIYLEQAAAGHPRSQAIIKRYPNAQVVPVQSHSQVFNGHSQNFRTQKQSPSLILALKENTFVHATPPQYETGGGAHYYFSHMLNCVYDCRYCFLQGMFQSANYLVFVNYEDFLAQIKSVAQQHASDSRPTWFFSGYDCDSLAFEPVTQFADFFLDQFALVPNAVLELRTKSTQIRSLLKRPALKNVVVAASLSPNEVAAAVEAGAPSTPKRIAALQKLQAHGWRIGIRFDPVIWHAGYQDNYARLIEDVFTQLDPQRLDSVTLGSFRVPKTFFKEMYKLYPDEAIFNFGIAQPSSSRIAVEQGAIKPSTMVTYRRDIETQTLNFVEQLCQRYVSDEKLFAYHSTEVVLANE